MSKNWFIFFAMLIMSIPITGFINALLNERMWKREVQNYECTAEQYPKVNYKTNMCIVAEKKNEKHCFYDAVINTCPKR